ncbi:ribonuclease R [Sebaldella sp. S0638]|uniref:ribonuclease R n=1 Tax=Sebaldella sp. S0638 TaxID=2957809 RepID=UPI00209F0CA3|nr:ribonuclease R [Sebaldella sp. S0638]MCP1225072.1 ribonuclease R [Sebaldella sp. S0638]
MRELKDLKELLEHKSMTYNEIISSLGWSKKSRKKNKQLLEEWIDRGEILLVKSGKYTLPEKEGYIRGDISITTGKFGFLDLEGENSIFIPGPYLKGAMNGDTVLVRILKEAKAGKSREGEVYKIVERAKNVIIGVYQQNDNFGFVLPREAMGRDVYVSKKKVRGAKNGDLVAVKIYFWGDEDRKPEGEIISILGDPHDTEALINAILINNGISEEFSDEVEAELAKMEKLNAVDLNGRKDLRDLDIITIDGSDAKDLDDAVYVEKSSEGYRLIVSIADVSHYVKEKTKLDEEALKRGNSIYLVDRVIPMLPRKLSNDLCSLNPNEDKLTFSAEIHFDNSGKVVKNDFYKSVIKSKHRMTYSKVNEIIAESEEANAEYQDIKEMITEMLELSMLLREAKKRRGSIDFELPEIKVVLNDDKSVKDIELRKRGESERIIEDFMVAANEAVAEKLFWEEIPAIYRVHEDPDKEKIKTLNDTLIKFGYHLKNLEDIHPGKFQTIIEKTKDLDEGYLIHKLILRAMQRARYNNKNLGHFGLSSKFYLHFTSPIRRYSDLIVHRVLGKSLEKFIKEKEKEEMLSEYELISKHISKTERDADRMEEESIKIKLIEYMQDKVGEVFVARISGMNKSKIFMELENHVEVVYNIHGEQDDYMYDEENYKMINTHNGLEYTIGNTLKVFVTSASFEKMEIEVIPYKE